MPSPTCVLDAPWLQRQPGCIDSAIGAAVWLWMHDVQRRGETVQDIEHQLLAPIAAGQYVIARGPSPLLGVNSGNRPQALLLFARFDEKAEARYLACPQRRIATREWCSGDRFWLIDWSTPFGHTPALRRSLTRLLQGHSPRSLLAQGIDRQKVVTFHTDILLHRSASSTPLRLGSA